MSKAKKKHRLVNTEQPNLVEDIYVHNLPPLIRLEGPVIENIDGEAVEFDFGAIKDRPIVITDTTFRDGQQARPPYTRSVGSHIRFAEKAVGAKRRHLEDRVLHIYQ